MARRRQLDAAAAGPAVMPPQLERFELADWVAGGDRFEDFASRGAWALRRWRAARDVWDLDHGEYRGRWLPGQGRWEQLGWVDLEERRPAEAARLRAAARRVGGAW